MTSAADLRAFLTRPATAARGIDAMQQPLPTDFIRATSGQGAAPTPRDGGRRWGPVQTADVRHGHIGRVVHLGARLAVYLHVAAVRHGGNVEAAAARPRWCNAAVTLRRDHEGRGPDGPRVAGVVSQITGRTFAVVFKVLVQTRDAESLAELNVAATLEAQP